MGALFSHASLMLTRLSFLLCLCLVLAGCFGGTDESPSDNGGDASSSSSSLTSSSPATRNVTYEGTIDELGITIYQQGTHRLTLDNGDFILLTSGDPGLDLDAYLDKRVEVRGSSQPTVEAGGTIMTVGVVTLLEDDSSSSSASSAPMCGGIAGIPCDEGMICIDDPSDDCDPTQGGADCSGICVTDSSPSPSSSSSSSSSAITSSSAVSSASSPQSPPAASSSSASSAPSSSSDEQIEAMAEQTYDDDAQWTQEYCTSHIGFCIPVHRNWFYKSFGTTTSFLWHVEFDLAAIENLGDGPLSLNLLSGSTEQSGQIVQDGSLVRGRLNWSENRHFEIVGDARLRPAIEYLLSHIEQFSPAEE